MGVKFKTVNGREQVEYQNKEGAVAKVCRKQTFNSSFCI